MHKPLVINLFVALRANTHDGFRYHTIKYSCVDENGYVEKNEHPKLDKPQETGVR